MSHMPQWKPSQLATLQPDVPSQDPFQPFNFSRRSSAGIDRRLYKTEAEQPDQVAPYLLRNIIRNHEINPANRSYEVAQGGDTYYFKGNPTVEDYAYNADRLPVPRPDIDLSVDVSRQIAAVEGVRFGAQRASDRLRGQVATREYLGHYSQPEGHRGRWFGSGGRGR